MTIELPPPDAVNAVVLDGFFMHYPKHVVSSLVEIVSAAYEARNALDERNYALEYERDSFDAAKKYRDADDKLNAAVAKLVGNL